MAQAVVLLKAGVGCTWFQDVLKWLVCFLHERLSFLSPVLVADGSDVSWGTRAENPSGSVVVYIDPAAENLAALFSRIGSVPGMNSRSHVEHLLSVSIVLETDEIADGNDMNA